MTNNMLIFDTFTKRSKEMSELGNVLALTGGVYNQNHEALFGQTAERVLTNFNRGVVIIGASGFMVEKSEKTKGNQQGAFHHDLVSEVVTKKAIVTTRTVDRVIVCDFSKIGIWDASCFSTIQNLSKNARKCTIVTSSVPQFENDENKHKYDENKHKYYEDLYRETDDELKRTKIKDVIMVRVDNNGNPVE